MKKLLFFLLCLFVFIPNIFASTAYEYVLMDMDTGKVLKSKNKDSPRLIASITKIMTCIIAIENGDLEEKIIVSKEVLKSVGSSIYIEVGEQISLKDLLYGMMLRSGNDAAIMVAIAISGSTDNFTILMNEYAKKLGMNNTIFYNSHGLEEDGKGNLSTAYDMAILTSYAMKNDTFKKIFSTKDYVAKSDRKTYNWHNKNKLLKYDYINGGKTGYTLKAHRTLVTTAVVNNMNVVVVTIDDSNDWQDHLTLYNYVNKMYKKVTIVNKSDFEIIDDTIFINDQLYIEQNIDIAIKKTDKKDIKIKYFLVKKKKYNNNEKVGYINVYLKEELIKSEPIFIKLKAKKKRLFS